MIQPEKLVKSVQEVLFPLMKEKNGRSNLSYAARQCIKKLKNTKGIIVREADKGSLNVVENLNGYVGNALTRQCT